tara:strand:+ start:459 stop:599 length:141 start_codon:yes stop_codon:yes gene_type:complete
MPVKLRKSLKALKNKVSITKKECPTKTTQKLNAENAVGIGKKVKAV